LCDICLFLLLYKVPKTNQLINAATHIMQRCDHLPLTGVITCQCHSQVWSWETKSGGDSRRSPRSSFFLHVRRLSWVTSFLKMLNTNFCYNIGPNEVDTNCWQWYTKFEQNIKLKLMTCRCTNLSIKPTFICSCRFFLTLLLFFHLLFFWLLYLVFLFNSLWEYLFVFVVFPMATQKRLQIQLLLLLLGGLQ